ncbi:unnamed protein product, partial [Polarella glacialis]
VSEGSSIVEDTQKVVGMFLKDFPEFAASLDWSLFARVVGVTSDRGTRLPGGERAVYRLSDLAAHCCAPNAVVETLGNQGLREVRCIGYLGIAEHEQISVSFVSEEVLLQHLSDRRASIHE